MPYDKYQRLSWKTFYIILLQNSIGPITISLIWIALIFLRTLNPETLINFSNPNESIIFITKILDLALTLGTVIVLLSWVIAILGTLIRHFTFHFMLGDDGIGIKKGLIHINETMIPYRHVENIETNQPLIYRIFGMCRLSILTGMENENPNSNHTLEINFPILEKVLADDIRKEIFYRTKIKVDHGLS